MHNLQIMRRDGAPFCTPARIAARWVFFNRKIHVRTEIKGQIRDRCSCFHSWQRFQTPQSLIFQLCDCCRLVVSLVIQSHLRGEHVPGVESGALMLQPPKGLKQESSSDKQNDRQPNFADDEESLQSRSSPPGSSASDALIQHVTKPGLATLPCRRQSKKNARSESRNERECPH